MRSKRLFNSRIRPQKDNILSHQEQNTKIQKIQKTVYKRPLPQDLIQFSSNEGKQLFKEAMIDGYMENYFALSEQFITQSEPSYCGPASLIMVLNALKIDPQKPWKGIWRWYDEDGLRCTSTSQMEQGMNLEEMSILARCNGLHTQTFRAAEFDEFQNILSAKKLSFIDTGVMQHSEDHINCINANINQLGKPQCYDSKIGHKPSIINHYDPILFKTMVQATAKIPGFYSIVNFGRKELNQTGSGHYATLGGYHPQSEKVLLMDTARFKYPPFWVDIDKLYESVQSLDKDAQKMRGFMVLSKGQSLTELDFEKQISLMDAMNLTDTPKVRFMSDLSISQLNQMIGILNREEIKIHIFKFLHDVSMIYGSGQDKFGESQTGCDAHGQQLSNDFFDQIKLLRHSCNDFEGIQKKLSQLMRDGDNKNNDLIDLVNMLEYMIPSYSLDMLTMIIIAAGNMNENDCAFAYGQQKQSHAVCHRVRNLDIFSLLR